MKVILKEAIGGKKVGDMIEVSDGYARNFLFPKGIAVPAVAKNINDLKGWKEAETFKKEEIRKEAQRVAEILNGQTVKIAMKAGANGKLFGSVTTKDIAVKIKETLGIDVDKKKLSLSLEIKSYGSFETTAKFMPGVEAKFFVFVTE
ncbi:MAG: 50S ribosomal protein L9 [Oscillospiraceae bacterium]|jgi:large subunit ribosomal protein L9|nr:50S ribosomal protein L9 [Oscillospiraceae bacterium]